MKRIINARKKLVATIAKVEKEYNIETVEYSLKDKIQIYKIDDLEILAKKFNQKIIKYESWDRPTRECYNFTHDGITYFALKNYNE